MANVPPEWRKSSHSAPEADCVEVNRRLTALRDSKNPSIELPVDIRRLVQMIRRSD